MDEVSSLWFHELITGVRGLLWALTVNINEKQIPCLLDIDCYVRGRKGAAINHSLCSLPPLSICVTLHKAWRSGAGQGAGLEKRPWAR